MKNFLKYFFLFKNDIKDHQPLTEFLKRNENFKKAAFKFHDTKEGFKNKFLNTFEDLLKKEDDIKLIDENKKTNNNKK